MKKITIRNFPINLEATFTCGQVFRWKRHFEHPYESWCGVIDRELVKFRQIDPNTVECISNLKRDKIEYFLRLDAPDFHDLIRIWNENSRGKFGELSTSIRLLRQDRFECLISFICSQNNNIARITSMLESLCQKFGDCIDSESKSYSFPSAKRLSKVSEAQLRKMKFGYRAPYIVNVANYCSKHGVDWMSDLESLTKFKGIGPKVAECISLFALDCTDIVPIDTHVWKIAREHFGSSIPEKPVPSRRVREQVSGFFQDSLGKEYAGWAHCILFYRAIGNDKTEQKSKRLKLS